MGVQEQENDVVPASPPQQISGVTNDWGSYAANQLVELDIHNMLCTSEQQIREKDACWHQWFYGPVGRIGRIWGGVTKEYDRPCLLVQ